MRVFSRNIYTNGTVKSVGGIGEVCTLKEYRRKGISKQLLRNAIDFMRVRFVASCVTHGGTGHGSALCFHCHAGSFC